MKKILSLFTVGFLLLGGGYALTQNINKALQLSQDGSGSFGVDTSNNVYFPAHVLNTAIAGPPTVSSPAGTAPTLATGSSDFNGQITGGSAGDTTGTLMFKTAYLASPNCLVISQNPATSPVAYNAVATGINITSNMGASIINYICSGYK